MKNRNLAFSFLLKSKTFFPPNHTASLINKSRLLPIDALPPVTPLVSSPLSPGKDIACA